MSRRIPTPAWLLASCLLAWACGPAAPPSSLRQLESAVEAVDPASAGEAAPVAWSEARRYLEISREALEDRDAELAERMAALGLIEARIAAVEIEREQSLARREAALAERRELRREVERARAELERIERLAERERLRRHLRLVVDETRRRAAADEEIREGRLDEEQAEKLDAARFEVALQLLARARMVAAVGSLYARTGRLLPERLEAARRSIDAAAADARAGDLAECQRDLEKSGIEVRRAILEAWGETGEEGLVAAIDSLVEELGELLDEEIRREELGAGLKPALRLSSDGGRLRSGRDRIESIAAAVEKLDGEVGVVVVAAAGDPSGAPSRRDERRSEEGARLLVEELRRAGLADDRLLAFGCPAGSPLAVLAGSRGMRVALLVVPLPSISVE
ncbi:MAG: hypothetical protein R6V85_03255 [Polyangia bacterium]